MTKKTEPLSQAAAEASRRNGANSKGPTSAAGKARSAQNARKHGLFGSSWSADDITSPALDFLAATLDGLMEGNPAAPWHRESVLTAAHKLEHASRMVRRLSEKLDGLLRARTIDSLQFEQTLRQLVRIRRYQRRFRGQRDRAMRMIARTQRDPE